MGAKAGGEFMDGGETRRKFFRKKGPRLKKIWDHLATLMWAHGQDIWALFLQQEMRALSMQIWA
jgi:hypothetical protein